MTAITILLVLILIALLSPRLAMWGLILGAPVSLAIFALDYLRAPF